MTDSNLTIASFRDDGADAVVVARIGTRNDRFFPPILAAQLLLDVRGLVHQSCYSRPERTEGHGAKEGSLRRSRRWAFAQEIYSNEGRGTESGHFLEHLVLELAQGLIPSVRARRLSGETSWNWREEPDLYRIRFHHADVKLIRESLVQSASILERRGYRVDVGLIHG